MSAARELLDDLAPSARTRRRRVADARVASVPVWATLFRAAVCCVALLHSVIVLNMEQNKKGTALIVVVVPFLSWNGIWTVFERFAPEGSIWGRVGADALTLLEMIAGYVPGRDSPSSIRPGLFHPARTGRLVYDSVGWLRRFVQKSPRRRSGAPSGRAPEHGRVPSSAAPAWARNGRTGGATRRPAHLSPTHRRLNRRPLRRNQKRQSPSRSRNQRARPTCRRPSRNPRHRSRKCQNPSPSRCPSPSRAR